MMRKQIINAGVDATALLKAELFSTLLQTERDFVLSRSGVVELKKKALLFSPGEKASHFYVLLQGGIRVFKPNGALETGEDEIARFMAGDTIGDFDFARGEEYDAYAEALEDSMVVMFPGYGLSLDDLALESPHTVSKILLCSIVMMTARIKSTHKIIVENLSWVQELYRKAYEDPGTGLWKQAFITDEINRVIENPTALIMLKPDRFKTLVDSRGHKAGDDAMVRIAMALRNITRRQGRGWPIRFKSNETGILITKCGAEQAEAIAGDLKAAIAALPPVPAEGDVPPFLFTGTAAWGVWPNDEGTWETLFQGLYDLLLESWKHGGDCVAHYRAKEEK
jgi:diguanylate cyclase (GGDEF)-like protein